MTTITDTQGNYHFDHLAPGTYRVVETQPVGYFSVGAKAGTVNGVTHGSVTTPDIVSGIELLGGEDSVHNDFAEALPNSLSGYVHADRNADCVFDPGEPPIAGVVLHLLNCAGPDHRHDQDRPERFLPSSTIWRRAPTASSRSNRPVT